jgi:biopolymer transport protein ExbB/TolQ
MWNEIAFSFQSGNFYMSTIAMIAFFSLVIVIERFVMLHVVYNINFQKFLGNLKKTVNAEDNDRAINLCKSAGKIALPKIALRALEAGSSDPSKIKGTIEEETIDFLPKIESRLNLLPVFATLILLIGVLGTIDGLWNAFHSINILDTAKKQASLALGIAGSLNPTAFGLMICMLILAFHQILRGSAIRLTEKMHHGVIVLNNLLVPAAVATYIAAPQTKSELATSDHEFTGDSTNSSHSEGLTDNDAFDDASIEDIKDEEEII